MTTSSSIFSSAHVVFERRAYRAESQIAWQETIFQSGEKASDLWQEFTKWGSGNSSKRLKKLCFPIGRGGLQVRPSLKVLLLPFSYHWLFFLIGLEGVQKLDCSFWTRSLPTSISLMALSSIFVALARRQYCNHDHQSISRPFLIAFHRRTKIGPGGKRDYTRLKTWYLQPQGWKSTLTRPMTLLTCDFVFKRRRGLCPCNQGTASRYDHRGTIPTESSRISSRRNFPMAGNIVCRHQ